MKYAAIFVFIAALFLLIGSIAPQFGQTPVPLGSGNSLTIDEVVNRFTRREAEIVGTVTKYTPLVETYLQLLEADEELGAVPRGDKYFLGKLDFKKGLIDNSLLPAPGFAAKTK